MRKQLVAAAALALSVLYTPAARPCGAVAPAGSFVRLASEETLILWDPESKTEHFLRRPVFEGDPKDFGFFVPTPVVPVVAKAKDEIFAELRALVPFSPSKGSAGRVGGGGGAATAAVHVEQTVQLDDFELVTLRATDAHALLDWLQKHGFASRPSLELWAHRYVQRGWVLNAMRYAPPAPSTPGAAREVKAPALRLSFAIDAPFYPYTEAPPSPAEEQAFVARTKKPMDARPLDLWVVAPYEVEIHEGPALAGTGDVPGPVRVGTANVADWRLETLLESSQAWGFHARSRPSWTVTRFREDAVRRTAFDDLTFAPLGASVDAAEPEESTSRARYGLFALALLAIARGIVLALTDRSPRDR